MDCNKIIKKLKSCHFKEIISNKNWLEEDSTMYAKEIRPDIFLLFIMIKDPNAENTRALIAHFDDFKSVGITAPKQILFYLSIKSEKDLHYLEKYLKTKNELTTF
ncbi:hypothetical protein SAMN05421846_11631 [Chryseobacterium taeanense]|uniref:Uncharacterized protein n=1 Tax=Chryseobacterium taeanense TaxID=311334 RepID=A0A1G8P1A1_9FLAO|nr:hypothetical protein [Chryseobacterium taeanense]SDI86272.1 hypothetical protein SAMN05421846_11631 [Chryseobacterium taeanense]